MIFIFRSRRGNFLQIFFTKYSSSSAFHLFEIILTFYISHKNQTFDWLNIRSSCYHIHSDRNTWIIIISKRTKYRFRIIYSISYFATKIISFAKLLTYNLHYIICMAICFRKNQCFWHFFSTRK